MRQEWGERYFQFIFSTRQPPGSPREPGEAVGDEVPTARTEIPGAAVAEKQNGSTEGIDQISEAAAADI